MQKEQLGPSTASTRFPMGSLQWTDHVFSTPPVRKLKGHSKHTQYHLYNSAALRAKIGVQGGNEIKGSLTLEYLSHLGLVRRVKPQPFFTNQEEFGLSICPDFLVQLPASNELVVVEVKSARFLTRWKSSELEYIRERFNSFGIKYLVWTDERPLVHSWRHQLVNMRASSFRDVTQQEIENLVEWVDATPGSTYEGLRHAGFDLDCLLAASWHGRVYFPLMEPLAADSPIRLRPFEDFASIFLGCENRIDDWWRSLDAA